MKNSIIIFLIFYHLFFYCSTSPNRNDLPVLEHFKIDIPEPSGLSFGEDYQSLWIVSDRPDNRIYEIDLLGNIIQKLPFLGDDLEGIAYDSTKNVLWIAEEQKREIVELDLNGSILQRIVLNIPVNTDHGLEGIAINPAGDLWVANEKLPLKIFVFNKFFFLIDEIIPGSTKDLSGLDMDLKKDLIWALSDESEKLISLNIINAKIQMYHIPVQKAEGIAVNSDENLIYIVSDSESEIYVFDSPQF